MRFVVLLAAIGTLSSAITTGGPSGASPAVAQPGREDSARDVAVAWVRFFGAGNQRAACESQVTGQVGGRPCSELPTKQVLRCPKVDPGRGGQGGGKPELLKPSQQVGRIVDEGGGQAFAILRAEVKKSRARGALGLVFGDAGWQVSYLRQGKSVYVPAGTAWMTPTWRRLWFPPRCPR